MVARGEDEVVGILGGMGPAATADFYQKLIGATAAECDQDHLRVIVWSDPTVPDRTAAILGDGPDPTPALLQGTRALLDAGATLIAVPCNTAHAFLGPVREQTQANIVHMIDQTVRAVSALQPPVRRVGLLATSGTVRVGLYQDWFSRADIAVVVPGAQDTVDAVIRTVKAGGRGPRLTEELAAVADTLVARGAQALIAGCTEIPLVFQGRHARLPVLDPTLILARAVVAAVRG